MDPFDQLMELEHQTKYRFKITVGEALRFLKRLEYRRHGEIFNQTV